jgi:hypothetical protein
MRIAWRLCVLALALGCEPVSMLPGGALSGTVAPAPADWSFTDSVKTVQLETRPDDPYSVNIWGVAARGAFYVASGRGESNTWAKHLLADPRVRLRVNEDLYELSAVRTDDPAERDAFLEAAHRKYDFEVEDDQRTEAVLFRLEPRSHEGVSQ